MSNEPEPSQTKNDVVSKSDWQKRGVFVAIGALIVALFTLLFGPGIVSKISDWKKAQNEPIFSYTYEGAIDQAIPHYEVSVPLGWSDEPIPQSNARIIVHAQYFGNEIQGPVYIKIQPSDTSLLPVEVGRWDDFSQEHGAQKVIEFSFDNIFTYSSSNSSFSQEKPDPSAEDPLKDLKGQFELFIEHEGKKLDSQQISVINTPWMHTVSLSRYEFVKGYPVTAWITVRNYGIESDFIVFTCLYRLAGPNFQIDMSNLELVDEGWWSELGLEQVCDDDLQTPLTLEENSEKIIPLEIPNEWLQEKGAFALTTFVAKKLPIVSYPSDTKWSDSATGRRGRDNREYTSFFILGEPGESTFEPPTPGVTSAVVGSTTDEVTSTLTLTQTLTVTPSPTVTPTMTSTLTPTHEVALQLPFLDNFDESLNPAWFQPFFENWFRSNQRLTLSGLDGRQDSYIFVGDPAWSNYKISLDFWFDRFTGTIGVIVRSNPPEQMGLRFVVAGYDVFWQTWQDGKWQTIETLRRHNYAREGKISVEVEGNTLSGSVDGLTQLSIDDYPGVPASGLIGLTSDCNSTSNCSEFDNFIVEEILP